MRKANVRPPYKPADSVQGGEKQESGLAAALSEKMKYGFIINFRLVPNLLSGNQGTCYHRI